MAAIFFLSQIGSLAPRPEVVKSRSGRKARLIRWIPSESATDTVFAECDELMAWPKLRIGRGIVTADRVAPHDNIENNGRIFRGSPLQTRWPGSFLRHQGSGFFRSVICKLTLLNLLVIEGNVDGDDDRYSRPDNTDYQLPECPENCRGRSLTLKRDPTSTGNRLTAYGGNKRLSE